MKTEPLCLGIDIGASNTKVIAINKENQILHTLLLAHTDENTPIADQILAHMKLDTSAVTSIALTGVGAHQMPRMLFGVPFTRVHEFRATGLGGAILSGRSNTLVVSMGTGTSFVYAKDGAYRHMIGSGVGGGTLLGLCKELTTVQGMDKIEALACAGRLSQVDLTIGEVAPEGHLGLAPDLTAANFGSIKPSATQADLVLGAYNLVFQSIGTMSVLTAQLVGTEDVVLVGALAASPFAEEIFSRFSKAYGIRFTIPDHAAFATAYGAVRAVGEK